MNNKTFAEAYAHGRLDVMGGIADYSGSLVLQMPIQQKTIVKLTLRADYLSSFISYTESGEELKAEVDTRNFIVNGKIDYLFAKTKFNELKENSWIAYVLGCVLVLLKEKNIDFKGADFIINSSIPLGKGVSSSASIEIATMKALQAAFGISFSGTELPTLAQRVENLIVGAPCGLMDQLSCYFGKPRALLPIVCQPDLVEKEIVIPDNVHFIGIDSGVRHSVGGSSYTDVRCAAFMGYTILAQLEGASSREIKKAIESNTLSKLPFSGYLCNISVEEYEKRFKEQLPENISGSDFLRNYGISIDKITTISATKEYAVRTCTEHPIYENRRVENFKNLLLRYSEVDETTRFSILKEMGELMKQSHKSYSICGLGSDRTDEITYLSNQFESIYGAKITGGGSGGTVCLLAYGENGKREVLKLHELLKEKYNSELRIFS